MKFNMRVLEMLIEKSIIKSSHTILVFWDRYTENLFSDEFYFETDTSVQTYNRWRRIHNRISLTSIGKLVINF